MSDLLLSNPVDIKNIFKQYYKSKLKLSINTEALYVYPSPLKNVLTTGLMTKTKLKISASKKYIMTVHAQSFGIIKPYLYGGISHEKKYIESELKEYSAVFCYNVDMEVDIGILYKNNGNYANSHCAVYSVSFGEYNDSIIIDNKDHLADRIINDDGINDDGINDDRINDDEIINDDGIVNKLKQIGSVFIAPNDDSFISAIADHDIKVILLLPGIHKHDSIIITRELSITSQSSSATLIADVIVTVNLKHNKNANVIFSHIALSGKIIDESTQKHTLGFDSCYMNDYNIIQNSLARTRIKNCYAVSNDALFATINNGTIEIFYSVIIINSDALCLKIDGTGQLLILSNTIFENNAESSLSMLLLCNNNNRNCNVIKYCAFKFNKYFQDDRRTAIDSYTDLYIENSNFYLSGGKYAANMNNNTMTFKDNSVKLE